MECDEQVICVAPSAEDVMQWKQELPVWELEVPCTYLIDDRQLVPADGRWIEWGNGQKEAFVRPGEVACYKGVR